MEGTDHPKRDFALSDILRSRREPYGFLVTAEPCAGIREVAGLTLRY
jgi:hypothetical protein